MCCNSKRCSCFRNGMPCIATCSCQQNFCSNHRECSQQQTENNQSKSRKRLRFDHVSRNISHFSVELLQGAVSNTHSKLRELNILEICFFVSILKTYPELTENHVQFAEKYNYLVEWVANEIMFMPLKPLTALLVQNFLCIVKKYRDFKDMK